MEPTVHASINYTGAMSERPRFHANDRSLDRVALETCPTAVADFRDAAEVAAKHTHVPLAVCDARTIAADDLVPADARFDRDGQVHWTFEALLLRHGSERAAPRAAQRVHGFARSARHGAARQHRDTNDRLLVRIGAYRREA